MNKWKAYIAGLATIASLSGSLWAQAPAIPAVPAAPGVPGAAVPAATPVGGLHQFLGLTPEIKEAKKRYLCSKPIGMMMSQMLAPMRAFTGGLFGNCCPGPSLLDTLKPGPEGAANKIKKDEAEAKARRAAVRYLGTVDCHFWPEAEAALIGALRADRNECVRWEAAMALGGGCCCTKKTIEALLISATGSDRDGNPSETCDRVRAAAFASLQHCLSCFSEEVAVDKKLDKPPEAPKPEAPKSETPKNGPEKLTGLDSNLQLTGYYYKLDAKPMSQTVSEARKAVSAEAGLNFKEYRKLPSGERGMYNILAHSLDLLPMESKAVNLTQSPVPSGALVTSEQMPVGPEMKAVHTESVPVKTVPMPVKMDKAPLFGPSTPLAKPAVDVKPMLPATTKPVSAKPMEVKPMAAAPVKPVDVKPMTVTSVKPAEVKPTTVVKAPESKPMTFAPVESRPMVATPVAASHLPSTVRTAPVASTHGPNPQQLLVVLRNSIYPFQREWAVDNLSNVDWRSNPEVVQALMSAARKDAAPTVRVMCIRSLVKMKVDTVPVVTTIQALRSDPDPRVEHEAQAALTALGHVQQASASNVSSTGSVQPASMTTTGGAVVPAGWNTPGKTAPASYGVGYPR